MERSEIVKWMKKYNVLDILKWIMCTSIHPNNILYQIRLESLLAYTLSIKAGDFGGVELSREEFVKFIDVYYVETDGEYTQLEDFHPFDQTQLIPYFYEGEEKFIFYGALERPYEFIEKFEYLYIKSKYKLDNVREIFEESLNFQTALLKEIMAQDESFIKIPEIYIPTLEFVNLIWKYFRISQPQQTEVIYCDLEDIANYEPTTFSNYFSSIFIQINEDQIIYNLPQVHIEILFRVYSNLLKKKLEHDKGRFLKERVDSTLKKIVFGDSIYLKALDDKGNVISRENIIFLEVSKELLILFYLLEESGTEILTIPSSVSKQISLFYESEHVSFEDAMGYRSELKHVKAIQFIPVIVYDVLTINALVLVESQKIDFLHFEYLDFKRMTEFLHSKSDLYKYLRELQHLRYAAKLFMGDQIDQLSIYLQKEKKFFEMGQMPKLINFGAHQWHDFYMPYLFTKYQTDVYKYLERISPNFFNYVEIQASNVYECFNTALLKGGLMARCSFGYTFIKYPISGYLIKDKMAVRMGEKVLKPLFAEYAQKVLPVLEDILENYYFSFGDIYYLELVPKQIAEPYVKIIAPYVNELNSAQPIKIITMLNSSKNELHSFVLYDADNLINIFDSKENRGERYCVGEMIRSILIYNFPNENKHIELLVSEITEKICPVAKRRYGITSIEVVNVRSEHYDTYLKVNNTDLSVVNRNVAQKLSEYSIPKKVYQGEDAVQLNRLILNYLSEELKQSVLAFDESILKYAYLQLDFVEFQREMQRKQNHMDADTDTDYDLMEKITRNDEEISKHSLAIKYIIAAILKWNPTGYSRINEEKWSNLLAIAFVINDTSAILDMANFKLQSHEVYVNDLYEISDNFGNLVFNPISYSEKTAKQKIVEREKILKARSIRECTELDTTYISEFGFSLFDMLDFLYYLGTSDFKDTTAYPLNEMRKERFIELIISDNPEFNTESLLKIINHLSLNINTYENVDVIAMANLMRYKDRINLCPIIYKNDNVLYGNQMCLEAHKLWISYYIHGDSPYLLNLPKSILKSVKDIHKEIDIELEKLVEKVAVEALGNNKVEARILNFKRLSPEFVARPDCGEIDLLAVNGEKKIIFVIDAKNINKRVRPYDVAQEIHQFFEGMDSYFNKLSKKAQFISENLEVVLKHFGVEYDIEWRIQKAFCVNHVYPSAFVEKDVSFVLLDELPEYLK